jgi:HAD superfamily hydrolase (TIGR01484 family)
MNEIKEKFKIIKYIEIDMDGTLLNERGIISRSTLDVLSEVQKQGIHISFASGRPLYSLKYYNLIFKVNAPVIAFNGAVVVDLSSNNVLESQDSLTPLT